MWLGRRSYLRGAVLIGKPIHHARGLDQFNRSFGPWTAHEQHGFFLLQPFFLASHIAIVIAGHHLRVHPENPLPHVVLHLETYSSSSEHRNSGNVVGFSVATVEEFRMESTLENLVANKVRENSVGQWLEERTRRHDAGGQSGGTSPDWRRRRWSGNLMYLTVDTGIPWTPRASARGVYEGSQFSLLNW